MSVNLLVGRAISGVRVPDIQSFHDYLLRVASGFVESGKEARPMVFVLTNDDQLAIIPSPDETPTVVALQTALVREPSVRLRPGG